MHRDLVELPDGTPIWAVSFDSEDPYARDTATDFDLYLDARWMPPWPHEHVSWPDFGLPSDADAFRAALRQLLSRARGGQTVELGCLGGHGRTGTALACLATLSGQSSSEAVSWVRANYCDEAVETSDQEEFVMAFGRG